MDPVFLMHLDSPTDDDDVLYLGDAMLDVAQTAVEASQGKMTWKHDVTLALTSSLISTLITNHAVNVLGLDQFLARVRRRVVEGWRGVADEEWPERGGVEGTN